MAKWYPAVYFHICVMSEPLSGQTLPASELARIQALEKLYDEWAAMLPSLKAAQAQWREARVRLAELQRYHESAQWQRDVEADAAGRIPADMPRGILAEDTLWNALHEEYRLAVEWVQLGAEALRRD